MSLSWFGNEIEEKVLSATQGGMDEVMSKAVVEAKRRVPVRTATLQGSLQMRPARRTAREIVGLWGSFIVGYAIYVEMGTGRMAARPYLRPAADLHYPRLIAAIRSRMR